MKILFFFLCFFCNSYIIEAQIITTIAGSIGQAGYSGDGGPAATAKLNQPYGLALDNAGNLYISDEGNAVIRKIDNAGVITTVAGNGTTGYSGDEGPATSAAIGYAWDVTVDNTGNLYIIDNIHSVVRKVNTSGIITTVAGNGITGYSGDGGPAVLAMLNRPLGIAADNSGNIYIADADNFLIRKVSSSGIITTLAGNGAMGYTGDGGPATSAQIGQPINVAVDNSKNVYLTDGVHAVIRKINTSGIVSTFAGNGISGAAGDGGPATSAQLGASVRDIAFDNNNNLYVADYLNHRIRKIDNTGIITTIAGTGTNGYSGDGGPAIAAQLNFPIGLAVDNSGTVYLTDTYDNTIRKIVDCALSSINLQPVNTVICSGQSTAFSVNGSNVASYQWQMNSGTGWNDINDGAAYSGTSTGTLAIVNSDVSLNNNQYRCKITGSCNSLFSTAAMLTVNSQVPGVSITAPSNAAICSGGSVTFTAVPLAGGTAPSYQWQLGGVNVGTNSPFYTVAAPADGDVVQCVMISNATCLTTPGANSNSIAIRILPPVTPAVSITASSVSICANIPVTFSASADNGGPALSYQWEVNGVGAGTNSMTYTTTDLNDGDVINCIMTGGAACMTAQTAPSNDIVIKVNRPAPASISISTPSPPVCKGDAVTFITTIDNGGNTPVYHWKINGIDAGTNENTFTSYNLANGDRISCVLTSSIPCVLPVSSEDLPVVIKPLPVLSAGPDTAVFPGNSVQLYAHSDGVVQSYSWSPSEGLSGTSLANPIAFATDSVTYYLTVTAEDGCQGYAKVKISLLRHLLMPNAFTPNHDGRNDVFRIPYSTALDLKDFSIFDRWGRLVFKTKDISKGWDGYLRGTPADAGSYVYLIRGNFQGEEVNLKGTVILIR